MALSLLSTVFVMGSRLWVRTIAMNHPDRKFELQVYMRELVNARLSVDSLGTRVFVQPGYQCTRTVAYYEGNSSVLGVSVICKQKDRFLGKRFRIVSAYAP